MTFTPEDLKHLEIMAHLNARPILNKIQSDVKSIIATPSESTSLTGKLMNLTAKLRQGGFENYASQLEEKWALFQLASNADLLYRAHTETGEDLIEFAHPEGDVEMGQAKDHLGDVETQISQHNKILEVVNQFMPRKVAAEDVIDPVSVSKLFDYMAKYIQTNFLSKMPPDVTQLPANQQQYYVYASKLFEVGQKLANYLNVEDPTPASQVLKIINDNLIPLNEKIPSIDQVNIFINNKLSWLVDHSPIKIASLIGMVKQALSKKAFWNPILVGIIFEAWTHTRRINQGIKKNAEILSGELDGILKTDEVRNNPSSIKLIAQVKSALDKSLPDWFDKFDQAQTPGDVNPKVIIGYEKFLTNLIKMLNFVNREMARIRRTDESSVFETIRRSLIASPFQDVQKAIEGLNEAIKDQLQVIAETKAKVKEAKEGELNKIDLAGPEDETNLDLSSPTEENAVKRVPVTVSTTKDKELQRLNAWKENINNSSRSQSNKTAALNWIEGQMKALQQLSDDNIEGLKSVFEQNNEFQKEWKV